MKSITTTKERNFGYDCAHTIYRHCQTRVIHFLLFYKMLKECVKDIHQHIRMRTTCSFPRPLRLETELKQDDRRESSPGIYIVKVHSKAL